jgi:hypothetical protein
MAIHDRRSKQSESDRQLAGSVDRICPRRSAESSMTLLIARPVRWRCNLKV